MAESKQDRANVLFRQVSEFIDELLTVDLNLPDDPDALAEAAKAGPKTVQTLDNAKKLLLEIDSQFEPMSSAEETDVSGDDESRTPLTLEQEISDLVFICLTEIRPCRRRLVRAIRSGREVKIVATSGEAYRRLNRSLTPLESALARAAGKEAPSRMEWDLEISLQVRKLYANLRQELQLPPDPNDEQVRESLISFILSFDDLKEREHYRFIRFDDRIHLDSLLQRSREWLREGPDADPEVGHNLWKELINLAELMRQVSIRTELRNYDQQVLSSAYRELFQSGAEHDAIPAYLREELTNLFGLDDELDWLIRNALDHPPKFWEHCLSRVLDKVKPS